MSDTLFPVLSLEKGIVCPSDPKQARALAAAIGKLNGRRVQIRGGVVNDLLPVEGDPWFGMYERLFEDYPKMEHNIYDQYEGICRRRAENECLTVEDCLPMIMSKNQVIRRVGMSRAAELRRAR
jgi:hypothetical protein